MHRRTMPSHTRHRHARPALAIACLLAALPLAGCQHDDPAPAPKATVTKDMFTPSPAASSPAAPTTPSASTTTVDGLTITVMPSDDPLYAEAVEVYSKFLAESWKLDVAGGAKTLPPVFKQYATGQFLSMTQELYQARLRDQVRFSPTTPPTTTIQFAKAPLNPGEVAAIDVCADARRSESTVAGKKEMGTTTSERIFFARPEGQLKAVSTGDPEGLTCPS